jgi:hypothetical protein
MQLHAPAEDIVHKTNLHLKKSLRSYCYDRPFYHSIFLDKKNDEVKNNLFFQLPEKFR